ncbi:hypothetical protein [Streptomyces noursei]|uniref:hypothetical protein n=1 Tax=Streptomyces noursei TaxID=1971 RepID=UPI0023B785AF|nr:hypothetical protein [Streptomyces noursei]
MALGKMARALATLALLTGSAGTAAAAPVSSDQSVSGFPQSSFQIENGWWGGKKQCLMPGQDSLDSSACDRKLPATAWSYDPETRQLRHDRSGDCLAVDRAALVTTVCVGGDAAQQWVNAKDLEYPVLKNVGTGLALKDRYGLSRLDGSADPLREISYRPIATPSRNVNAPQLKRQTARFGIYWRREGDSDYASASVGFRGQVSSNGTGTYTLHGTLTAQCYKNRHTVWMQHGATKQRWKDTPETECTGSQTRTLRISVSGSVPSGQQLELRLGSWSNEWRHSDIVRYDVR